MAPKLTFITPVKNGARYFRQCLDSITAARAAGLTIEHLVMDAASTDGTVDMLVGLPDTHVFIDASLSAIAAMDFGVHKATGDYIFLIMSDDYLEPDFAAKIEQLFARGVDFDLAICACRLFSSEWERVAVGPRRLSTIMSKYHGMNSVLIRRETFASIEMPLRYRLSNDRMMMLMLWEKASSILIWDEVLASMRFHEGSQGNKVGGNDWETLSELARVGHELMWWNPTGSAHQVFSAYAWRRVTEAKTSLVRLGTGPKIMWPPLASMFDAPAGNLLIRRGADALVRVPGADEIYAKPFPFAASGAPCPRAAVTAESFLELKRARSQAGA